ncbi:hypothetical protein LQG66_31655 [Bradyrhizobium ontarionense]|uniref:NarX-like N-terminal domain-containing protein n=1 Tax=Bradyrhizobium ontarionense TaxID=2898149 RepID=A0ABY3R956_9BRAD|nr:hypothetical protein [Bradyrhizobium sp. A19]UFZ03718.1 hypothetical protein LQG66_31655 [Bradyrhizobium sp. A19]
MLRRAIMLSLLLLWCFGHGPRAEAGDSNDLPALMQSAMAGLRTAASYGRTGNIALAQIELDDARRAWTQLSRLTEQPIAPYVAKSFADLLATGRERLSMADDALTAGDSAGAAADIATLRRALHALRREAGVVELSDCVFDLSSAMDELRSVATRFGAAKADTSEVVQAGTALRERLQRCNGLAPPDIAGQAEFRRLIDGAIASAGEIGSAARTGDAGLVHRYQIELQSFVNLLDFRFG